MRILVDDIPAYSDEGRDAIEMMHLDYASLFFYFEDDHHESVYERFIERMFPKLSNFVVICLGGKSKVLAKARQDRFPNIQSIFIVDRDFDDFLQRINNLPDVFYFDRFSFENYLIDPNAIMNLCIDENSRTLTKREANTRYSDFGGFRDQLINKLLFLTKIYLVARTYSISIETTKASIESFLNEADSHPLPSDEKMASYLKRVTSACINSKDKAWLSDQDALLSEGNRIFSTLKIPPGKDLADFCCGKHLLGCVIKYFDSKIVNKLSDLDPINMYTRLLSHLDLFAFSDFRKKVASTYGWSL